MIVQKKQNVGGLLLRIKNRPSGKMEKNGEIIEWETRKQISILSFEGDATRDLIKYSLSPSAEEKILEILETVHWGCLIELELDRKREVVSVTVVADILKDFYETELDI